MTSDVLSRALAVGLASESARLGLPELHWVLDDTCGAIPILRGQAPPSVPDHRVTEAVTSWATALGLNENPIQDPYLGITHVRGITEGIWVDIWGVYDRATFESSTPVG